VIGIPTTDIGTTALIDQFRDRNVSLIKSLAGQQLNQIESLLEAADSEAVRVEVLRGRIQSSFGVTKSKADLLARDQVLKLNGQLTQTRQQNAGITQYIWRTSGDERVRESHSALDGTVQAWASPPVISDDGRTGHPGDDYQCRCTADPILPELEDGVS
jgi:SPP1 gp7 family putative phage head morphogenesis protein